jgi:hypothetical protein
MRAIQVQRRIAAPPRRRGRAGATEPEIERKRNIMRVNIALLLTTSAAIIMATATGCAADGIAAPDPRDPYPADVVMAWNAMAHEALTQHDGYANPLAASRVLAMMHIAQHDAINSIDRAFETYAFDGHDADAHPVAAAAAAAHGVLAALFPAQRAAFDDLLNVALSGLDPAARERGVLLGGGAAAAIIARRVDDGSDTPIAGTYEPGTGPGRYQFTPPFPLAFAPGWRGVTPFGLGRADRFRPAPPPSLESSEYAAAFNEVKALGALSGSTRSGEQTAYAHFWYEYSEIGWNRVARVVTDARGIGLHSAARLFALLNMALADAYIAGWDGKYHYDLWRPYTAIRAAATDGNPATAPDAEWEPALPTPPVQDYPSTHSALGDAAAVVLAAVFGDATPFSLTSTTADAAAPSRSFSSFSQAADENADSRVAAGLHFRFATDAGQQLGRSVGEWTIANHLRRR